jgi:hypothetical protein
MHRPTQQTPAAVAAAGGAALCFPRRAQEIEPTYCEPTYWMGLTKINLNQPQEGVELLKKAVDCKYTASDSVMALGQIYKMMITNHPSSLSAVVVSCLSHTCGCSDHASSPTCACSTLMPCCHGSLMWGIYLLMGTCNVGLYAAAGTALKLLCLPPPPLPAAAAAAAVHGFIFPPPPLLLLLLLLLLSCSSSSCSCSPSSSSSSSSSRSGRGCWQGPLCCGWRRPVLPWRTGRAWPCLSAWGRLLLTPPWKPAMLGSRDMSQDMSR